MPRGRIALTFITPLLYVTDASPAPLAGSHGPPACASKPYWVVEFPTPVTLIFPEATTIALPMARLSACMPPPSILVAEVRLGPLQFTLTSWAVPVKFGIANANIAQSLAVPATLIVEFVAIMVAAPLDCIRSPVLLLLRGLAVLLMIILLVVPSAVIMMSALPKVTPVVLAALTALTPPAPAGMTTLTPD